jgi:hypothetical protein
MSDELGRMCKQPEVAYVGSIIEKCLEGLRKSMKLRN